MEKPPNPFFPEYERKPEWLKEKLHVPAEKQYQKELVDIVAKVRSGRSSLLLVIPSSRGIGTTHFLYHELRSELEALGCVCAFTKKSAMPWDNALRSMIDLPQAVSSLAAPEGGANAGEPERWLPEAVAVARKRSIWREKCGIGSEARQPYTPKVFSHTLARKEIDNGQDYDEEDEIRYAHFRPARNGKCFTNINALGELAAHNGKVLCVVTHLAWYKFQGSNSKSEARIETERVIDLYSPYMNAKNILVITVMPRPSPLLTSLLAKRGFAIARIGKRSVGWVTAILDAHQKESGFEWFTQEALDAVAKKTKCRVAHAMWNCYRMAEEARVNGATLPLDVRYVKQFIKRETRGGRHEIGCEDVRIRF